MNIFQRDNIGANKLTARVIMTDPVLFLAFGFGAGLAKKAPGTLGTVAAIPVYLLFIQFSSIIYNILTLLAMILGIWLCGEAAKKLGEHDFGGIVWDEVAGFLITMAWVPVTWQAVLLGFALFRLFDIIKPWPIKWIDRHVEGGFGIMLDDVLAGVFAAAVLQGLVLSGWLNLQ